MTEKKLDLKPEIHEENVFVKQQEFAPQFNDFNMKIDNKPDSKLIIKLSNFYKNKIR